MATTWQKVLETETMTLELVGAPDSLKLKAKVRD